MGKANKTRKFAAVKRMINPNDSRLKVAEASKPISYNRDKDESKHAKPTVKKTKLNDITVRQVEENRTSLYFEHNMELGPPYHIIIDTNFINFSIQYKLDMFNSMMDCLLANACHA